MILSSDKMAPKVVKKQAKRRQQKRPSGGEARRPCIRRPEAKPQCNDKRGKWRKKNCPPCSAFQGERRRVNNCRLSRVSRTTKCNKRRALLAEVEANEAALAQAGKALDWQEAEVATWQVQIEEMLRLREMLKAMRSANVIAV